MEYKKTENIGIGVTTPETYLHIIHNNKEWKFKCDNELAEKLYELESKNKRLKDNLIYYGWHNSDCHFVNVELAICSCGFDEALKGK